MLSGDRTYVCKNGEGGGGAVELDPFCIFFVVLCIFSVYSVSLCGDSIKDAFNFYCVFRLEDLWSARTFDT